jgi:chemotaxis signal transduction protein
VGFGEAPAAATGTAVREGPSRRTLGFELDGQRFALRLADVGGLANCGPIRAVPGSPPAVLGLTEWRGTLLTVLDLPRLLDVAGDGAEPCLVRLAPPLRGVALYLPAVVRVLRADRDRRDDRDAGASRRTIDPIALVRGLEAEIRRNR